MQPRYWPDDADVDGLIFLPRFVDKIGFRVFADWTGTEVTLSEVDLLPERAEANNFDRIIASSLLREHRPDLGQQDFISSPWSAADNGRRHELWRIAQQLAEREYNAPPRCRLRCIRAEIRRQSCTGELTLKIRRVSGGPFETFQPVWWNRDNPNELFDLYIIDPKYPFGERPSWKPNTDSWIFAPREGIDQIAARLMAQATPEPAPAPSAANPSQPLQAQRQPQQPLPAAQPDKPVITDPAPAANAQSPTVPPVVNPGGRPTDRDLVLEEAAWRLRHQQTKAKSLAAFAGELHRWVNDHGEHRDKKTGEVMKVDTIKGHVRPLWNRRR